MFYTVTTIMGKYSTTAWDTRKSFFQETLRYLLSSVAIKTLFLRLVAFRPPLLLLPPLSRLPSPLSFLGSIICAPPIPAPHGPPLPPLRERERASPCARVSECARDSGSSSWWLHSEATPIASQFCEETLTPADQSSFRV